MKKLKLNFEELQVESFETSEDKKKSKGTIIGQGPVTYIVTKEPCDWCNSQECNTEDYQCQSLMPFCN